MCVGVGVGVCVVWWVCGRTYLVALVSFQINNNSHVFLARVCLVLAVSGKRETRGKAKGEVVSRQACAFSTFYFWGFLHFFFFIFLSPLCVFLCAALLAAADTLPRLPHPWPGYWSALSRPVGCM